MTGQANEDELFVVFKCDGNWDRYTDYTAEVTPISKCVNLGNGPASFAAQIITAAMQRVWTDPLDFFDPPMPDYVLPEGMEDLQIYQDEPWEPDHSDDGRFVSWKLPVAGGHVWVTWNADDGWATEFATEASSADGVRDALHVMDPISDIVQKYPNGPSRMAQADVILDRDLPESKSVEN